MLWAADCCPNSAIGLQPSKFKSRKFQRNGVRVIAVIVVWGSNHNADSRTEGFCFFHVVSSEDHLSLTYAVRSSQMSKVSFFAKWLLCLHFSTKFKAAQAPHCSRYQWIWKYSHCHTIHLNMAHTPTRNQAKDRGCALHISAGATAVLSFRMVDTDEITCLIRMEIEAEDWPLQNMTWHLRLTVNHKMCLDTERNQSPLKSQAMAPHQATCCWVHSSAGFIQKNERWRAHQGDRERQLSLAPVSEYWKHRSRFKGGTKGPRSRIPSRRRENVALGIWISQGIKDVQILKDWTVILCCRLCCGIATIKSSAQSLLLPPLKVMANLSTWGDKDRSWCCLLFFHQDQRWSLVRLHNKCGFYKLGAKSDATI